MFRKLLTAGAVLCFGFAVFQLAISIVPAWSAAFGAAALAANPLLLLITGSVAALLFAIGGLYGLSGAGRIRRLPLLRLGLLFMGLIFTLRGSQFVLELLMVLGVIPAPGPVPLAYPLSSLWFLLMGLLYLVGLVAGWKSLSQKAVSAQVVSAS
jgi:hypothetical protein